MVPDVIKIVTEMRTVTVIMSVGHCVALLLMLGNVKSRVLTVTEMEAAMKMIVRPPIPMWVHDHLKCAAMVSMTIVTVMLMKRVHLVQIPMVMAPVMNRIVPQKMARVVRAYPRFAGMPPTKTVTMFSMRHAWTAMNVSGADCSSDDELVFFVESPPMMVDLLRFRRALIV